ncbi:MAG: RNA methyltransferase [Cyanobacteria bacterium J06634_6]
MSQVPSSADALAAIRIVLVAPAGPLNVGSVARVMKNFGLSQLVLVNPQCDPLGPEALQMAVHADDILQAAKQVQTIPEALEGCDRAIATTARNRGFNAPLHPPDVILPTLLTPANPSAILPSAPHLAAERSRSLIFGPEDRGLSNTELTYAQHFTKIPTTDTYSALNLAQAVTVCCYELRRAALQNSPLSVKQTESNLVNQSSPDQATLDQLEGYYQHLESILLKVEYLYPHTAASRMRKLRQLLHRSTPTTNEVALLRGILRQVDWALSDSKKG